MCANVVIKASGLLILAVPLADDRSITIGGDFARNRPALAVRGEVGPGSIMAIGMLVDRGVGIREGCGASQMKGIKNFECLSSRLSARFVSAVLKKINARHHLCTCIYDSNQSESINLCICIYDSDQAEYHDIGEGVKKLHER